MASGYSTTTVMPVSTGTPKFPVLRIMSGDSSILCPYVSPRSETVSKLADLIDEQKVVHVRGTPASGKTTLAQLLQQYYEVKERNSIYIDTWRELEEYLSVEDNRRLGAWGILERMLRTRFGSNMDYLAPGTILIVDEAQGSYSDTLFWNSIIKPRLSHEGLDINFCLFCCYGSPLSGVDMELDSDIRAFTPAHFKLAQRVTLTPQSRPSSPPISLFFTRSEFTDAAQRLIANSRFQEKFTLRPDAEDYLFSLTNGHPGGLSSVLKYIHDFYRHAIKSRDLSVMTKEHVVDSLKRDQHVWDILTQEPISRSLPQGRWLTTEVANLLAKVLEEGNVIYQGKTLSSGAQPKPIEAQYQVEFYRCFNKIAGRGVPVSTEWSSTTDGRVDFWIPGQKWALEIVREEDRINEHIMRFHENGQYYPWRVDDMIQDWIIINCTTSPPTRG
ncbi:hypothetical protein ETB97_002236 [Aspergillus alliaceus]|uniref:Novel STAND NTPase 3 domain-containing protein n=1 Tax=Petromyces alliaceus TaxID=209559 RepID=A0A8H6E578_PETAA|nr:hypothetical protein ETB97_002236 [Aspergillus burnettii]